MRRFPIPQRLLKEAWPGGLEQNEQSATRQKASVTIGRFLLLAEASP